MPDAALTTRITERTFRRLKVASAQYEVKIQDIVEAALQGFLAEFGPHEAAELKAREDA